MKISFTPEAVADLGRLRAFIESKSPIAAQRIANELLIRYRKAKSISRDRVKSYSGVSASFDQRPVRG